MNRWPLTGRQFTIYWGRRARQRAAAVRKDLMHSLETLDSRRNYINTSFTTGTKPEPKWDQRGTKVGPKWDWLQLILQSEDRPSYNSFVGVSTLLFFFLTFVINTSWWKLNLVVLVLLVFQFVWFWIPNCSFQEATLSRLPTSTPQSHNQFICSVYYSPDKTADCSSFTMNQSCDQYQ